VQTIVLSASVHTSQSSADSHSISSDCVVIVVDVADVMDVVAFSSTTVVVVVDVTDVVVVVVGVVVNGMLQ